MTPRICRRCGSALTKVVGFCARCGQVSTAAEIANLYATETNPGKQNEQTVPPHAAVTEEMPAIIVVPKPASDSDQAGPQPSQPSVTNQAPAAAREKSNCDLDD